MPRDANAQVIAVRDPSIRPRHASLRYRRAMLVRRFDDPNAFRGVVTPYLVRDEARHNLLLGISTTLIQRPDTYELFDLWCVSDGGDVVGAALRTPPYNLVLAQPASDAALYALVDRLLEEGQDLPGVIAAVPEVEGFVSAWTAALDVDAEVSLRQGIYEVREVLPTPDAAGAPRAATPADRDLVVAWMVAFGAEALPDPPALELQARLVASRLEATEHAGIWLWEDEGRPVSMCGYGSETPNGIRIGPVYTPPELRGRGYATSLVAAQTSWLLGSGRTFAFLYTDLDNPTSNALYRRIGYRMVAEAAEVRFDPRSVA
jgi:predicted GNAT family acetyltransferase